MSKRKDDRSLLDRQDRKLYNLATDETNQLEAANMHGVYGHIPPVDNYWTIQAPPYWDPSLGQVPHVQYPPTPYYQPYDYSAVQPQYPFAAAAPATPISKTPRNKPAAPLPPAPIGRAPPLSSLAYSAPVLAPPLGVPAPIQPAVVSAMPVQYSHPPPPAHYYHRSPSPPHYRYSQRPPSPYYHYRHRPPSPYYYRDRHRPPSPHYYHDRHSLPPISRKEAYREHDYYDRHRDDSPVIMSYFGRRRDVTHRPDRWYQ